IECRLFEEHEIPWGELAFPSVEHTLRHYFEDRKQQVFPTHLETLGTRLDHTG
ncbi:NUDIX hydrolase, partial [Acinetobacter baumannii]